MVIKEMNKINGVELNIYEMKGLIFLAKLDCANPGEYDEKINKYINDYFTGEIEFPQNFEYCKYLGITEENITYLIERLKSFINCRKCCETYGDDYELDSSCAFIRYRLLRNIKFI
jgi:hypothetical protein